MKRMFRILICVLMLTFWTNVNAESIIVTDKETLTISGVSEDDRFKVYKILDIYKDETSNSINYEFTETFMNFLATEDEFKTLSVENYLKLVENDQDFEKLMSRFGIYVRTNTIVGEDLTTNMTLASASLEAGSYLVLPSIATNVYGVMVGNIDVTADGNGWKLNNSTIVAKVSQASVQKTIGNDMATSGSYSVNEEIVYNIEATVPTYSKNATNKTYTIKDIASDGLTFKGLDSIIITVGDDLITNTNGKFTDNSGNTVATATIINQTLTINFDVDYINVTNIKISYKAFLNENAQVFQIGNKNGVSLTYANKQFDSDDNNLTTITGNETTAYTYGIKVFKYAKNSDEGLENAIFYICKDEKCNTKVGEITTSSDGYGEFVGLGVGEYYLVEHKAPSGYKKLNEPIKFTIEENSTQLKDISVANSSFGLLPTTGGSGIYIFLGIGSAIIVSSIVLLAIHKKGKKENV